MTTRNIADETAGRIKRHIAYSKDDHEVRLIWRGYIAALLEWGQISGGDHDDLSKLLPVEEKNENDLKILFLDVED